MYFMCSVRAGAVRPRTERLNLCPQTVTLEDGRRLRVSVPLVLAASGQEARTEAALLGDGFEAEPGTRGCRSPSEAAPAPVRPASHL